MSRVPTSEQVQVNFRMPESLREQIKEAARDNRRSMNAEIIQALEWYYSMQYQDVEPDTSKPVTVSYINTPEAAKLVAERLAREMRYNLEKAMIDAINSPDRES